MQLLNPIFLIFIPWLIFEALCINCAKFPAFLKENGHIDHMYCSTSTNVPSAKKRCGSLQAGSVLEFLVATPRCQT
jgi:hypothetical protein